MYELHFPARVSETKEEVLTWIKVKNTLRGSPRARKEENRVMGRSGQTDGENRSGLEVATGWGVGSLRRLGQKETMGWGARRPAYNRL